MLIGYSGKLILSGNCAKKKKKKNQKTVQWRMTVRDMKIIILYTIVRKKHLIKLLFISP